VHQRQLVTETGKSQLDVYFDEANLDFHCYEDMDVLQWWKRNNNRFPDLSILACDLLSVPITTVASDFEFCMGSRVFNKYKDRLLSKNVETRMCTRTWLHNFVSNGNLCNLNVNLYDFIVLIATFQFNYYPPQLWHVDGADDNDEDDDDDDFEETMNKVDGDVQTEQASTDFDFEDDN